MTIREGEIMKLVDKLKNIFFEEEEEEEEVEDTRPPKKEKEGIEETITSPTFTIIKEYLNGELPLYHMDVYRLEDSDDEIPSFEPKKEIPKREPKIDELIFEDEDFILDPPKEEVKPVVENKTYIPLREEREKEREKEIPKKEEIKERKEITPPYEYTIRKEAEAKKTFIPSPIISPIYGILDKNYKKEEVKEHKEIRLSTRPGKMDLDSVRNKAFGDLESELLPKGEDEEEKENEKEKFNDEQPKRDIKKIKENIGDDKPVIEKVTLGEADEYYSDLGLAYNADYKDISKEINDGKVKETDDSEKLEDNLFDLIEMMHDKEE